VSDAPEVNLAPPASGAATSAVALERWWNTLRWLRPTQLYGRVWFRAYRPRPDLKPAPTLRFGRGPWVEPAERAASLLGPELVSLLDETREIGSARAWDAPEVSRLWRYHLHYFDDLSARDAASRSAWHEALLQRWIVENPPGRGTGWEPYPSSRRIVNWIKWGLAGAELSATVRDSLAAQTRYLQKRLEWHLLGNHLWSNAKALVFAGSFFAGSEADAWRERGATILERQLGDQFLDDGGHFEKSAMYHALALEDVLDVLNLSRAWPGRVPPPLLRRLLELAPALSHWLDCMCHPDGDIALFNDSALDIAPTRAALIGYAARLGLAADGGARAFEHLAASGYVRALRGPFALFCDVGNLGPDHLPGHAHADSLSFELSVHGRRWVVDSGCSTYATGPERLRQRGTAAHNTVVVDGRDSSEVWSSFRVARRARVRDVSASDQGARVVIEAAHDGYLGRAGPLHRRRFVVDERSLLIADQLEGPFEHATSYWHLHPDVTAEAEDPRRVRLTLGSEQLTLSAEGARLSVEESTWHPGFNRRLPNLRVVATFEGPSVRCRLETA
jgi:uncharacterized heparinase superfamily protein